MTDDNKPPMFDPSSVFDSANHKRRNPQERASLKNYFDKKGDLCLNTKHWPG